MSRLERYCAFQERCRQEVSIKLQQLGVKDDAEKERIIQQLEKKRFVDEARYAKAFAKDKFNLHQWGKIKIKLALQARNIPHKMIAEALSEISALEYNRTLHSLLKRKTGDLMDISDPFIQKNRIAAFLEGKGYEPELIWKLIDGEMI